MSEYKRYCAACLFISLRYEDLIADTEEMARFLFKRIGLKMTSEVMLFIHKHTKRSVECRTEVMLFIHKHTKRSVEGKTSTFPID